MASRVSIHAPRAGCDKLVRIILDLLSEFQFTHPVRGATAALHLLTDQGLVSIHAPRAGCDILDREPIAELGVSIHAPRAGCDIHVGIAINGTKAVSIHAPRAGCDR